MSSSPPCCWAGRKAVPAGPDPGPKAPPPGTVPYRVQIIIVPQFFGCTALHFILLLSAKTGKNGSRKASCSHSAGAAHGGDGDRGRPAQHRCHGHHSPPDGLQENQTREWVHVADMSDCAGVPGFEFHLHTRSSSSVSAGPVFGLPQLCDGQRDQVPLCLCWRHLQTTHALPAWVPRGQQFWGHYFNSKFSPSLSTCSFGFHGAIN